MILSLRSCYSRMGMVPRVYRTVRSLLSQTKVESYTDRCDLELLPESASFVWPTGTPLGSRASLVARLVTRVLVCLLSASTGTMLVQVVDQLEVCGTIVFQ